MIWDFDERLAFSQGNRGKRDAEIIKNAVKNCISVRKTDEAADRAGVDYIATLKGGAEIGIDVKARAKGCSRYWRNGHADLLLEIWSVCPDAQNDGKIGWTLSDKTNVDFILFTYDAADTDKYYLLPYQPLRMAFQTNYKDWVHRYGVKQSTSIHKKANKTWHSTGVFVPANVVLQAMIQEMQGSVRTGENVKGENVKEKEIKESG